MLPSTLWPEVDNIIDQLDHPLTEGLDLVKFCPEHHAVDQDALDLFYAALLLAVAQAGMLACFHSSTEAVNLEMFDVSVEERKNELRLSGDVEVGSDEDSDDSGARLAGPGSTRAMAMVPEAQKTY